MNVIAALLVIVGLAMPAKGATPAVSRWTYFNGKYVSYEVEWPLGETVFYDVK